MENGQVIQGGFLFIQALYDLAFNILIVFYRLFGENLGLAIIGFTLALKLATLPFSIRQVRSAEKSREFRAKYDALQAKHKNSKDKEKLTKELAQLQSEYLPAQLGGCLPTILQLLFFFQVYYVIVNSINAGVTAFNAVNYSFIPEFAAEAHLNLNFFGINLGQSLSTIGTNPIGPALPYIALVLLVGATQYFATRAMSGMGLTNEKPTVESKPLSNTKARKQKGAEDQKVKQEKPAEDLSFSDAMQQSSQNMLYIFPLLTMFLSVTFPAGLSLYWTVTNGFAIIQQLIIKRPVNQPNLSDGKTS